MSKKPGVLYKQAIDESLFYYIAYNSEQQKEFRNKIYCHKLTLDFQPVNGKNGQPLKVLKDRKLLIHVGFVD